MNKIVRLSRILEMLKNATLESPMSLKTIESNLGNKVSIRTIQRDIRVLRDEYTVPIENMKGKGCYLEKNDFWDNTQNLARFFEMEVTIEQLKGVFTKNNSGLVYVDLEKNDQFKGLSYINTCLEAISNEKILNIKHQKFQTNDVKDYVIQPYLLKEYQNRWYLVGVLEGSKNIQTFGLDRIQEIKLTDIKFKRNLNIQPELDFERVIGLNYGNQKGEKVLLEFTAFQGEYIKTLPLHKSQKIVSENENKITFELNVIPNHELKQKILFYTPFVKIIEPKWLKDEVFKDLEKGLKLYK